MGTKAPNPDSQPNATDNKSAPRRSSFGMLLRRSKSTELKQRKDLARLQAAAVPTPIPSLPKLFNSPPIPPLPNFGGQQQQEPLIRDSVAIMSNNMYPRTSSLQQGRDPTRNNVSNSKVPIPPIPTVDPYARTESMTHRGRYSQFNSL